MKAASDVLRGVQKPLTLFGVPPQLFALAAAATAVTFGLLVAIDLMQLALIGAIAVFVLVWGTLFRATRRDCHFANLVFVVPRFWRGRKARVLLAGGRR